MPRLLLVNPANGASFWGMDYALPLLGRTYSNAPLAVLTVAGLAPDSWDVTLVDENVEPVDLDADCDIVGITAMNVQAARAFALADAFRRRGKKVVMGGPFVTLQPERCVPHADVVFVGEAERTFPRFCREFEHGEHSARYEDTETVDLAASPIPRFDLLKRGAYAALPIQTTRGCPFTCEFCDIIVMQGRRVRTKPIENVIAEMAAAKAAGADSIFFTDDNFVGNLKYARDLLTEIIARRDPERPHVLFTQASVNLADHPNLLSLMVRAGFTRLFLGIETPRKSSLLEVGKKQNTHGDLLDRIKRIQRAGIMIWAGMIVGFDGDDPSVFEEQAQFLDDAGIAVAMIGMLNAPPRTPLFERLTAEGRIDANADWADMCAWTNIIPKRMSRAELFSGFAGLVRNVYDQENYARRVTTNILRMGPPDPAATGARVPHLDDWGHFFRALGTFTLSWDPTMRRHFLPNFLRILAQSPKRIVEAAVHLGIYLHFARYAPELSEALERAATQERVRGRERQWADERRYAPALAKGRIHLPLAGGGGHPPEATLGG